jgi:hypothetical protein
MQQLFQKWVSSVLEKQEVFINGDGETSRDFCCFDNTGQMNLLAATTTPEYTRRIWPCDTHGIVNMVVKSH